MTAALAGRRQLRVTKSKGQRVLKIDREQTARCFGFWAVTLVADGGESRYEIAAPTCNDRSRFLFRKVDARGKPVLDDDGNPVAYTCEPAAQSCTCKGRQCGFSCRHLDALAALAERGEL